MQSAQARTRLPVFPLPVVLFPGVRMPLHVFEPRYRRMMAHAIEGDGRFGILYHDPDRHGPYLSEAGQVGTVAEIEEFQPLPDGRSFVLVRGEHRFRVLDGIESDAPYYEVLAEPYLTEATEPEGLSELRLEVMRVYGEALSSLGGSSIAPPLMEAGRDLSYQLADVIRIDPAWQQDLLNLPTEYARLQRVNRLMSRIVAATHKEHD